MFFIFLDLDLMDLLAIHLKLLLDTDLIYMD
nr:MAG TPA: hypothetical protein [Caudoviricetes sp.]